MSPLELRFKGLVRTSLMDGAAPRPIVSALRFDAIAAAPEQGTVASVRTSTAFAARFDAQANSSGLALDHARTVLAEAVRVCHGCGQQAGPQHTQCPNCSLDLESAAQVAADTQRRSHAREEMWEAQVRAGTVPEARFARLLESRPISNRPWRLPAVVSRWESLV